jgi:hypothetical protein
MALTDPQKFKEISETEVEANRTSTAGPSSVYETSDGLYKLSVSTTVAANGRKRHLVRIDASKIAENPFEEGKSEPVSMSTYVVVDRPVNGFTQAEMVAMLKGLVGLLSASTYAVTKEVLGGES